MYKVVVEEFGSIDQLKIVEQPDPVPGPGQLVVRMTSIGMNHAELMQRRGEYRLTSGDPPFTPGLEGGGVIHAVGPGVADRRAGQHVTLSLDAPRRSHGGEGTYQSHYLTAADKTIPVPESLDLRIIGALWLPYLTAWGCLIHRQKLRRGQTVLLPAASSSTALAAAQVAKEIGAVTIGTTTSPDKLQTLKAMPVAKYDHLVVTRDTDWYRAVKQITGGRGCEVIFDPVAAGEFLNTEVRLLAPGGTIWLYGLLGEHDVVDLTPLIIKRGAIRGWLNNELIDEPEALRAGYQHVLDRITDGRYRLSVARTIPLRHVREAHELMEKGLHVGKLILLP